MFVQVAAAIADDIRRGALRGGDRLPSTRALAAQLAVHRNTIVAAYDELVAQGWVVTRQPRGTFVCDELPERAVRRAHPAAPRGIVARPGFDMRPVPVFHSVFAPAGARYYLSAGVPDTRLLPGTLLSGAYRRALRSRAGRAGLDYGDPRGEPRLRAALAAMLRANRGIPAVAENLIVTRGSQMGLDLAARLLVRPGDCVAVEQLGYRPAWRAFEEAGACLVPVALDGAGLVVDALPAAPRCVHVTPHHQYPTMVLLTPARRIALLERARRDRFAIIEDDYDHEFHFEGRPVAPLAAADPSGNVLYLGTLSKILAPGLRLGFVAASERAIESLARLSASIDRQGDQVLEYAVAELIEDGELQRHARKMRRIYESRRDALASALTRELAGVVSFQLPPGGITVWARVDDSVDLEAWRARAVARGVVFSTAREFALDGRPRPYVRLAYARYDEAELGDAVRRMRRALDDP
jgi:GntR family transcriptional regulator/MocR family aminotransferase